MVALKQVIKRRCFEGQMVSSDGSMICIGMREPLTPCF